MSGIDPFETRQLQEGPRRQRGLFRDDNSATTLHGHPGLPFAENCHTVARTRFQHAQRPHSLVREPT